MITHRLLLISDCYLYCATHGCLLLPCLCAMAFTVEYLQTMEKEMKSSTQQILKSTKSSLFAEMNYSCIIQLNKDVIAKCLEGCLKLFEKNIEAASEIDKPKIEQINKQNEIIMLQQSQIRSVQETVHNGIGSVQETVKAEMCSWAKIVEKSCKQTDKLSAKSVEQAVKNVTEEEERSRNYIVYGLEEAEPGRTERLMDISTSLFEKTGHEQPYPDTLDAYRLGEKQEGKTRPVKVTLRNAETVRYLLRRAYKLRENDQFKNVYLTPDRSKKDRTAHSKLVSEMRGLIEKDSTKYYFIRDGKIKWVDKK